MVETPASGAPAGGPRVAGARAERKRLTRRRIAEVAFGLFARDGFDAVTVADVARAAGVTEKTVFNHFATKEDLVYSEDEGFEKALLDHVRARPAGESAVAAAERFFLARYRRVEIASGARHRARTFAVMVTASPSLQARERQIHTRYAEALGASIASEQRAAPGDIRPRLAAEAVIAVHREAIAGLRDAILSGVPGDELAPRLLGTARQGFALLTAGLADYAPGPP
ncbi:MAG: TetR family transcriptional regulator [Streptosporangiales bacterium]|nr:TetR family transcriptional regulator [Streptosporangiales bacterium]